MSFSAVVAATANDAFKHASVTREYLNFFILIIIRIPQNVRIVIVIIR